MPVPVWDCSDLKMDEPLDSVLSDDIWKKFDLDEPLDVSYITSLHSGSSIGDRTITAMTMMNSSGSESSSSSYEDYTDSGSSNVPEFYGKYTCVDPRKIRHHDCMWAGLCISKEHNRTLPAKKDSQLQSRKVPAGRSLLISSRAAAGAPQQISSQNQQQMHHHQTQQSHTQRRKGCMENDGDSARPETPQSTAESETESDAEEEEDYEEVHSKAVVKNAIIPQRRILRPRGTKQEPEDGPLVFRHDQISINEKLSECMSRDATPKAAPVSEVTGQQVRKLRVNRTKVKDEYQSNGTSSGNQQRQQQQQHEIEAVNKQPDNWNTLSDHCYHQPSSKKLEHLGVQTPSDSEEEIDVVTFEKPCRPAVLPNYPSIVDQQNFQSTVNTALHEKPEKPAPRPRGRPPSNGTARKRNAPPPQEPPPPKRACQRRVTKNSPPTPAASPLKTAASTSRSTSSSDSETDSEKRSLHNNMERQRRIDLRNYFEDLRLLVPEVEIKEKAAKVTILRQAAIYCDMLTEMDQVAEARVAEMKREQERLRARLCQLRKSLAMTR